MSAALPAVRLKWRSAGHEATSRCEAIDQLDADSASQLDFELELSRLIPQPGSSAESTQLRRLREIQERTQEHDNASGSTSNISIMNIGATSTQLDRRRQHVTRERESDGVVVETELYWSGKKLVWSRGGVIVRAFSYEEEVKCACWAWMDSEPTWERPSPTGKGSTIRSKGVAKAKKTELDPISDVGQGFGKDEVRKVKSVSRKVFRALCVFMPSCLVIYHPHSGQEYIKRLDLEVLNVFPLKVGLLIQRSTEAEDRKRFLQARQGVFGADPPLSTLFYLRRPYDELKATECVEGIRFARTKGKRVAAKVKQGSKGQTFNEVDERVILVSDSPSILVSASLQSSCLRIYAYAHDRVPLARYEDNREAMSTLNGQPAAKKTKENESSPFGPPLARRSTTENKFGARPKLPARKSSRLESASSRTPSLGGPRSSIGGDRTRSASGAGHVRRSSAGLTSMYVQGTGVLDEEGAKSAEEDDLQEMMQLLDEFDEVGEESLLQQPANPPGRVAAPSTVSRRRTSRTINPTSVPPRTPYVKSRPIEERRTSRSRMSMPAGSIVEGNPISVAMELSQKDEASKIAMTATSGDKAMSRGGLSSEGVDGSGQAAAEGLSIFQELAQGFSAVTLLEEVAVPELQK